ncbi:MAG: peptide chain release factor 3 [Hydrotalea flava]|uniref:peptide chain release factor 3 n=1 Tax=Hydrotalea TaxID=1004300 RepID=UPI00168F8429|nr:MULTISPECIES: peptide chain release factor 3 [Hydrotalea]MBY0347008.1 peptide chain release factor 3 [Hydrotalea flava]NIM34226.1 peptide chain release factor 3 [Hydrotalea flava]NIM37050.1 peptide chain release factor 3 [Hydrotalea flava]NIN02240.1 peptide chain release factor 3 [Hydrotalea flava]NIN13895.1 peptide chain release factor 3 [Hydrotalea flava]
MNYQQEIERRKTFAIISHPDAGKTTLTEKLLLFGGAIQTAGAVKSNKIKKHATSDFMEIERQRGISVATSVMTFEYEGYLINLLDTPGHKDFAEDTYRTLTAVDSVVLVIDSVNGVEEQTRRLMEVCRMRDTPVIVFINKMDRDGKNRFDLLEEIEKELNIALHPMTWPINSGKDFKGVYNITNKNLLLFTAGTKADDEDVLQIDDLNSPIVDNKIGERDAAQLREDVELIEGVHGNLVIDDYLAGKVAPVFFGSAVNNFGVQEMLNTFIHIAPTPRNRATSKGSIAPDDSTFSGFIFKIHANLDPRHRDRIAFLRVCSGKFERSKYYHHVRLNKDIRFNNPYSFLARSKDVIEDAYPGDVVGLFDTGNFKIGDTLTAGANFYFLGIPTFSPEIFKELVNKDPMKAKQLEKGIQQLTDEGVAQLFSQFGGTKKIIGCVGELQFEVIQYRLLQEYGAAVEFRSLPFYKACWLTSNDAKKLEDFLRFKQQNTVEDKDGHPVYLAQSEWFLNTEITNNPDIIFHFSSEIHK